MTRIADLPENLRALVAQFGFTNTDDVAPTRTDPAHGDLAADEQVTLYLRGAKKTGFLQVHTNNTVTFFSSNDMPSLPIAVAGISRWAAAIDPAPRGGTPLQGAWPAEIRRAEAAQSRIAMQSLQDATGIRPGRRHNSCAPEPNKTCDARVYAHSSMQEYADLPIGHPAKDFLEGVLTAWGTAIRTIPKIADRAARAKAGPAIYNTYFQTLLAMKSVKAFYDAGFLIAKQFPHLADKPEINLLYPAAGSNVGALATAMALIDAGLQPKVIKVQFTEIDTKKLGHARTVLQQWIDASPYLEGTIDFYEKPGRVSGGTQHSAPFIYKRHLIILTYAIADSPGKLYFHPDDAAASDIVLIHDPYSDTSSTETVFLRQLLPHVLSPHPEHPKAIVITNEFDHNPLQSAGYFPTTRSSVLPLRGSRTNGSFGHGGDYPIRSPLSGVTWWSIPELGQPVAQSALVFSTAAPLLQTLHDDGTPNSMAHNIDCFVDFAQLAGGQDRYVPADPGDQPGGIRSGADNSWEKHVVVKNYEQLLQWVADRIETLSGRDRDILVLTAAWLIIQTRIEKRSLSLYIPLALRAPLQDALTRNGVPASPDAALNHALRGNPRQLVRIDQTILTLQQSE